MGDLPIDCYWQPMLPNPVGSEDDDGLDLENDERASIRKRAFKEKSLMVELRPKLFADIVKRLSIPTIWLSVMRTGMIVTCTSMRLSNHRSIIVCSNRMSLNQNLPEVSRTSSIITFIPVLMTPNHILRILKQFVGESMVSIERDYSCALMTRDIVSSIARCTMNLPLRREIRMTLSWLCFCMFTHIPQPKLYLPIKSLESLRYSMPERRL